MPEKEHDETRRQQGCIKVRSEGGVMFEMPLKPAQDPDSMLAV